MAGARVPGQAEPSLVPGRLHDDNTGAIDWGWHRLVAYACHAYAVVLEPTSLTLVQTLDEHKANVCCLRWAPQDKGRPSRDRLRGLRIATGDVTGQIFLWDALQARVIQAFLRDQRSAVLQMEWVAGGLLVVYANYSVVFWEVLTGNMLWKKDMVVEEPVHLALDPFNANRIALASASGWVYFAGGVVPDTPFEIESKYKMSNVEMSGDSKGKTKPGRKSGLKQLLFAPGRRHALYLVLHREVVIFDLTIHQPVGSLALDRGRAPFMQLVLLRESPELAFCLHENGSISAWAAGEDHSYDIKAYWELQRFNKQNRKTSTAVLAIASQPLNSEPTRLAMVANDGTAWIWEYKESFVEGAMRRFRPAALEAALEQNGGPGAGLDRTKNKVASFCIAGLLESLSARPTSMAVVAGDGEKSPSVALGTVNGTLQVVDLSRSAVEYEVVVTSNTPLKCVRWIGEHKVLGFSSVEQGDQQWRNLLHVVDVRSGKCTALRSDKGTEATYIRGVEVSSSKRYFVVLLRDHPFEVWDARSMAMVGVVKLGGRVTALAWCPLRGAAASGGGEERLVATTPDGQFHHLGVQGGSISRHFSRTDREVGTVTSIAWKGRFLVTGDTSGTIATWDFDAKKGKLITTSLGMVRRIRFAPSDAVNHILVLFKEGDFAIWDLDAMARVSSSGYLRSRELKAMDLDWAAATHPVVCTTDGAVRVLDRALSLCSSPWSPSRAKALHLAMEPLHNPQLLLPRSALRLQAFLQNGDLSNVSRCDFGEPDHGVCTVSLPPLFLSELREAGDDTAMRCLLVARYFGDALSADFWTLVQTHLPATPEKHKSSPLLDTSQGDSSASLSEVNDATSPVNSTRHVKPELSTENDSQGPLLPHFDLYRAGATVHAEELSRARLHGENRGTYELTQANTTLHLLLGQRERATELLLETAADDPNFMVDALRACVISATRSRGAFEETMQLVASTLIAHGKLDQGVELLVLVGKGVEACHYLQHRGQWDRAAWLARVSLSPSDAAIVQKRWAAHLVSIGRPLDAAPLLLEMGLYHELLQLLHEAQQLELASRFLSVLEERGFLNVMSGESVSDFHSQSPLVSGRALVPMEQLTHSIRVDFGYWLIELGAVEQAKELLLRAGEAGRHMLEQFDIRVEASLLEKVKKKERENASDSSSLLSPSLSQSTTVTPQSNSVNSSGQQLATAPTVPASQPQPQTVAPTPTVVSPSPALSLREIQEQRERERQQQTATVATLPPATAVDDFAAFAAFQPAQSKPQEKAQGDQLIQF